MGNNIKEIASKNTEKDWVLYLDLNMIMQEYMCNIQTPHNQLSKAAPPHGVPITD